ncbi:MAG: hypothetical protein ACYCYO_00370 [Bacilli bacterium]
MQNRAGNRKSAERIYFLCDADKRTEFAGRQRSRVDGGRNQEGAACPSLQAFLRSVSTVSASSSSAMKRTRRSSGN